MPGFKFSGQWRIHGSTDHKSARCPVEEKELRVKDPVTLRVETFTQDKTDARSVSFSEQEAYWTLPLHETSIITDVTVTKASQPSERDVIHVATINPTCLYSIDTRQRHVSCIDLYSVFPSTRGGAFRPMIQLAPLSSPHGVVVHEATSNTVLNVNWQTGEVSRIDSGSLLEAAAEKLIKNFRQSQGTFKMCYEFSRDQDGMILFYKVNSQTIEVVHLTTNRCHTVQLPVKLGSVSMMSKDDWLITEAGSDRKFILHHDETGDVKYSIRPVQDTTEGLGKVEFCASEQLHNSLLSAAIQRQTSGPNRVLSTRGSYATVAVGLPESDKVEFHTAVRETAPTKTRVGSHVIYLPDSGQVISSLPTDDAPKDVYPEGVRPKNLCGYLEVCDLVNRRLRYLPVPAASVARSSMYWLRQSASEVSFVTAATSNDGLVTVDGSGCVRLWETALSHIQRSIGKWRGLIGEGDTGHLQLTVDRDLESKQVTAPKHGRVDPTGDPHVGGNTWAGGTGGRDTAGLGGIGGPYRLDAGHTVHQVSEAEKAAVPEEVKRAAREMGQKAFKQRLREIEMSEYDASVYEKFSGNVQSQVKSIRIMLDSLQAKGKERQWMRNQTYGDLDEARLIEGLAGEKSIYRRRGEKEPEMGSPQQKPKMMQIVCDVSGSMYRFNGHDGRLMREMEAMAMFMEALENYEQKIKYSIVGHSGEGFKFDFVNVNNPPKNNKERLMVMETLHAHSQFCLSGDHTLDATRYAIETIVTEDADEHFVIVLSDANFDRYGIPPRRFADILTANEDVNAYVIFIGSLGDQAQVLMSKMPPGRAFLCMDTKDLPQILQQIFTSTMLK